MNQLPAALATVCLETSEEPLALMIGGIVLAATPCLPTRAEGGLL